MPDLPFPDLPGEDADPVSLHDLRGNTVLVEFWATWCGPCRRSIPHLNAMTAQFTKEPVRVLAVSLDDPAAVAAFLQETPVDARVGADIGAAWHDAFGVATVPTCVLIGPDGRLAAVRRPADVTAALVRRVADGEVFPEKAPLPQADPDDADPLFKLLVRQAEPGADRDFAADLRGELPARTAAELWRFAVNAEPPGDLPAGRFDLSYRFPPGIGGATRDRLLADAVRAAFGR